LFFSHLFRTTNARRPIKGSKGEDFRLVFLKRKKPVIASWDWGPRPWWCHTKPLNQPHLWHHLLKTQIQTFPMFFNRK